LTGDFGAAAGSEPGQCPAAASPQLSQLRSLQANPLQHQLVGNRRPDGATGTASPALLQLCNSIQASASLASRHWPRLFCSVWVFFASSFFPHFFYSFITSNKPSTFNSFFTAFIMEYWNISAI